MSMHLHSDFARNLSTWALLPPEAASACATWEAASDLVLDSPIPALRAAVQSGKVNEGNVAKAIERAAVTLNAQREARALANELDLPLSVRFSSAITAGADDIVTGLAEHFAKAAGKLTEAAAIVPAAASAEDVLNQGPVVAEAWHTLANTASALDAFAAIRTTLARTYSYEHIGPPVAAFLSGVFNDKELTRANFIFQGIENAQRLDATRGGVWRHLVDRGYRLRLNTRDEASTVASITPLQPVA